VSQNRRQNERTPASRLHGTAPVLTLWAKHSSGRNTHIEKEQTGTARTSRILTNSGAGFR